MERRHPPRSRRRHPELAGLVTPLSNGIEWALVTAGVGYASTVLIQGPGQQGLSQVVACKQAGASTIIVTGTPRDAARLALARELGADHTVDVTEDDPSSGSSTSPADAVWTSSSTAPQVPAPPPCCSASMPSSAARASWWSRASSPRSPTSP
ncbi:hypothetical protein ACFQ2Y_45965 [Streptomyces malaysiensis subsp. malaysiensis]